MNPALSLSSLVQPRHPYRGLHPCPALSSPQLLAVSLAKGPSSPAPRLPSQPAPGSPPAPRASLPQPQAQPSTPARCLPPSPPPVSPSPALTWEVRGVGARMTHSVMMQSHNTQLHSPTDRGTGGRPPLAAPPPPPAAGPAWQPGSGAPHHHPPGLPPLPH